MAEENETKLLNTKLEKFTSYEKARMIGSRALQIAQGAKPLIKLTKKQIEELHFNPIEIAKLEYEAGKIPLSIKRAFPHEGPVEE